VAATAFLSSLGAEQGAGQPSLAGTAVLASYRRCRRDLGREGAGQGGARSRSREQGTGGAEPGSASRRGADTRAGVLGSGAGPAARCKRQLIYNSQWSTEDGLEPARGRITSSQESVLAQPEVRVRRVSGSQQSEHSINSSIKEVSFIKADDHFPGATDERMIFTLGSKLLPFSVCSTIPFNKDKPIYKVGRRQSQSRLSLRGPEGRNRLRHASGSRALPAINDSFDAFEQLGLERAEPGQVHHCTALLYFYQNRHKMHI